MPSDRGAETRSAIHDAARRLFTQRGYAGTPVRDIAREAAVDPALVIRYFSSKEELFLTTMRLDVDLSATFEGPLDTLGERFVTALLEAEHETRDVFLALVRASETERVSSRLRLAHEELFVAPLRTRLDGPDADLRARMASAVVGGLLYARWMVGDETLLAADRTDLARRYGTALQAVLTP